MDGGNSAYVYVHMQISTSTAVDVGSMVSCMYLFTMRLLEKQVNNAQESAIYEIYTKALSELFDTGPGSVMQYTSVCNPLPSLQRSRVGQKRR
jgi:hypothetical protein